MQMFMNAEKRLIPGLFLKLPHVNTKGAGETYRFIYFFFFALVIFHKFLLSHS